MGRRLSVGNALKEREQVPKEGNKLCLSTTDLEVQCKEEECKETSSSFMPVLTPLRTCNPQLRNFPISSLVSFDTFFFIWLNVRFSWFLFSRHSKKKS